MASLKAYEYTLQRLLAELRQQQTELIAAPGRDRPDEAAYRELSLKLEQWVQRLRPITRELRNREQFQALRGRGLHQLPREARYSERQSIAGTLAGIEGVWRLVAEVIDELRAIDRRRHGPASLHDLVRGVEEIARDWAERVDDARELQQIVQARSEGPVWRAASKPGSQVAPGDLASVVVTSVMLIAWLVQRLRR